MTDVAPVVLTTNADADANAGAKVATDAGVGAAVGADTGAEVGAVSAVDPPTPRPVAPEVTPSLPPSPSTTEAPSSTPALLWSDNLSTFDKSFMMGLPLGSLVLALVLLRVLWRPKSGPKFRLPKTVPTYGTVGSDVEPVGYQYDGDSNDLIYAGQVAGRYDTRWTRTFDFTFLVFMAVVLLILILLTCLLEPALWTNGTFWLSLLPKLVLMMGISALGGMLCRLFCIVDDMGYVITERKSSFKVNYTRKFQLLAAYLIPLVVRPDASCQCDSALALAWGDFVTLLAFLVLIKPLRERVTFFMLQFNSLDRPEDRPHTLKWIVAGNLFPAMLVLMFFRWLLARTTQAELVFVLIFVASIGDGLAEPIGIAFGKHKYSVSACLSKRKYTRSYEGSAVVFLSGMVFPAAQYFDFASSWQLLVTMLVLPFVAAYAEATAPHTMDAPVLMTATGLTLYTIIHLV